MAIMATDMAKKSRIATACAAILFTHYSFAGDWQFTPALIIDETYSDNVELTVTDEISSLVSQTGISIDNQYKSQYLEFDFSSESIYAMYSHDHDIDDDFHKLNSSFNLKLGKRGFSLFGQATVDNRAKSGARNGLADIVSGDTTRVETYSGGIKYAVLNSDFKLTSSLAYNLTQAEDSIGDQKGYNATLFSQNGRSANVIFWDADGTYRERRNNDLSAKNYRGEFKLGLITSWKLNPFLRYYDEDSKGSLSRGQKTESNSYGIGIRWLVLPSIYLDLSYNKPIGTALDLDGNEQKEYVDTSLNWQPSVRTKLEVNFSQRFYGDSYALNFSHQNKRLTNSIEFKEIIQSFTRNNYNPIALGSFWCPSGNTSDLNNCFISDSGNINFDHFQLINLTDFELIEDDVLSLNKTLSWNSALKLPRTSYNLNAKASERENLETRNKDYFTSIEFSIERKVSGRSNINIKTSYTDNIFQKSTNLERQDRYRRITLGYSKSLGSNISFDFDLGHINRSSNTQQLNYQEGRVTFKIKKEF